MTVAATHWRMLIDGEWKIGSEQLPVQNKYSGETIASVPKASREDVEAAIAAADRTRPIMARMPAHQRSAILEKTSELLAGHREEIAGILAAEVGKAWKFAIGEVDRATQTFKFAAEEAKRIHGETIQMDAHKNGEGMFGYFLRTPVGVVGAITPFNFPLNLVAHKVAPALAAGNTVVLKPASTTPLTAIRLCQLLTEAGLPAGALNIVVGSGSTVGDWIVTDPRVAKVTFTGSAEVGRGILARAGIKKVTMELGNNSAVLIEPDADLSAAIPQCAVGAFSCSGQICISVQRIYVHRSLFPQFTDRFLQAVQALQVGDPLDRSVDVGPMIELREAERVEAWVREAVARGARVLLGGRRDGPIYLPTVLTDVTPEMKVVSDEIFGPVVCLIPYDDLDEGLRLANASEFGLQAGIFTRDISKALRAVAELEVGGVTVNTTPNFRVDQMPYGGNKQSGLGREGLRFAIEEMTNIKMVSIRL